MRNMPDENAVARSQTPDEERMWGTHTALGVSNQLLVRLIQAVDILAWQNTKDGQAGRNAPEPIPIPGVDKVSRAPTRDEVDEFDRWYATRFNAPDN